MGLTIKEIESAKPRAKKYKLADGGGLCLIVKPSGAKLWLWRYRFDGIEKNMSFGEYPLVGPKDARELHFAAKKLLASGVNPMAERKAEAEAKQQEAKALQREADSSFEKIARKWWAWWSIGKSPRHAETLMNRLEADVFPVVGHMSIDAVQTAHIRDIMLTIETRGASDVAKRAHQSIGQIFRFAIARELASRNPAAGFKPRDVLAAYTSRCTTHDSGPVWFAIPSLHRTCTCYSSPVSRRTSVRFFTFGVVTPVMPQIRNAIVTRLSPRQARA